MQTRLHIGEGSPHDPGLVGRDRGRAEAVGAFHGHRGTPRGDGIHEGGGVAGEREVDVVERTPDGEVAYATADEPQTHIEGTRCVLRGFQEHARSWLQGGEERITCRAHKQLSDC